MTFRFRGTMIVLVAGVVLLRFPDEYLNGADDLGNSIDIICAAKLTRNYHMGDSSVNSYSDPIDRPVVAARAFVINPDDRLLLVAHDPAAFWYTPGGHVAQEESLVDCAKREIHEETGVDAEIGRLVIVEELIDPETREHKIECCFLATTKQRGLDSNWTDTGGPIKTARFFSQQEILSLPAVYPEFLRAEFWALLKHDFSRFDPYRNSLSSRET